MKNRKLYLKTRTVIFAVIILSFIAIGNGLLLDKNTSNPSSSASAAYPADINSDGKVDVSDLSTLVGKWGTTDAISDINKDGSVNIFDLSMLISKWGVVPTSSSKPDATNSGVPAGITLRNITTAYPDAATKGYTINTQGRATITKDGGIYEGVIFPAGVVVKAKNVIIRNSLIEGGRSSFANMLPEPTSWDHCRQIYLSGQSSGSPQLVDANSSLVENLLIEDSEIRVKPTDYSVYVNNYMGHDTTMRRVNMSGGVDAIGIHNAYAPTANSTIEDSYIHDLYKGQVVSREL